MLDVSKLLSHHFNKKLEAIKTASVFDDTKKATDLIIDNEIRVAVRIRSAKQFAKYGHQFTIRNTPTKSGSEWQKICKGFVHYGFYAFENASKNGIACWRILDYASLAYADSVDWFLGGSPSIQYFRGGSMVVFDADAADLYDVVEASAECCQRGLGSTV